MTLSDSFRSRPSAGPVSWESPCLLPVSESLLVIPRGQGNWEIKGAKAQAEQTESLLADLGTVC